MSVEEHLLELEPCEVSERREQHERPHLSAASTHPCAVRKGRISRQRRRRSNGLPCADGFVDANIVLVRKRTVRAGENQSSRPPSPDADRRLWSSRGRFETRL